MWSPCEFMEKTPFRDFRRRTRGQGASVGRAVGQFGRDESQSLGNGQKHGRKTHHFCLKGRLSVEMVSFWRCIWTKDTWYSDTCLVTAFYLFLSFLLLLFPNQAPQKGKKIEKRQERFPPGMGKRWALKVVPFKLLDPGASWKLGSPCGRVSWVFKKIGIWYLGNRFFFRNERWGMMKVKSEVFCCQDIKAF